MARHEKFKFSTLAELENKITELSVDIKNTEDFSVQGTPFKVGNFEVANRFAILPMEGCDSELDGSPSELLKRRYIRYAEGGVGLIWWEACAIVEEGKANPLQKIMTVENIDKFRKLVTKVNKVSQEANGYRPLNVIQLTHSGRYSRPIGHNMSPLVPQRDPLLDSRCGVTDDSFIVTDEYLESLIPQYVKAALLAKEAGFDGVDIKACHRYLLSELLASHNRDGKYGGDFEKRSRLLLDIIKEVRVACGEDFIIAVRFNAFDAHPYPYGFGVDKKDFMKPDLTEPRLLVEKLVKAGVQLLCNSAGNPYYIYPQVTRPFDQSNIGIPLPEEHPLESTAKMFAITKELKKVAGNVPVVGCGYSWLRQFLPNVGAANIEAGLCDFIGLGRQAFAYPDLPNDVIKNGGMDSKKSCIACSKCTQIMRDHGRTGCVIKDGKIYAPLYKQYRKEAEERAKV